MASILFDGAYGQVGGFNSGTEHEFPLSRFGNYAVRIVRTYKQTLAALLMDRFTGSFRLGVTQDPEITDAYLDSESNPTKTTTGLRAFTRIFSNIPADVVSQGSRVITKPAFSSVGGTGDIFIYDGATLTTLGAAYIYSGYFWGANKIYGAAVAGTQAASGGNLRLSIASHGVAGTEDIVFQHNLGSIYYRFTSAQYTVVDPNTIDLIGKSAFGSASTTIRKYLRDYTPGTDRVGLRTTQKFYLPGVTSGITTAADIPIPSVLLNDSDFLASAFVNLSGWQTYDATELVRWQDGQIYTQSLLEINMGDI